MSAALTASSLDTGEAVFWGANGWTGRFAGAYAGAGLQAGARWITDN